MTGNSNSYAQSTLVSEHGKYRFITMRRHNDIEGVEAVYDDYRRNWLKRHNSDILVGQQPDTADTPRCSSADGGIAPGATRINCGGRHVFRTNVTGFAATDSDVVDTNEAGFLGYAGYEYLFSNDAFLGFGLTYGTSFIDHRLAGSTLDVDQRDIGAHLVTGYRFGNGSATAWNVSVVKGNDDLTRNGTITGEFDSLGVMISGVWFNTYDFAEDLYLSYALDYTFLGIWGGANFTDSSGAEQFPNVSTGLGDFTPSLMLVKNFDNAEAFVRIGSTIEVFNRSDRPVDATADVGGSWSLSDAMALTGTVGGTYRVGGLLAGRGSLRLVGKF